MRKLTGCVKKADHEFNMIQEGDVVAVGLSGGKDSILLLRALCLYRRFSPVVFQLKAITVHMGFIDFHTEPIEELCDELGVELIMENTQIGKVIFEDRKEKNPCALCATMRRGRLNRACQNHGINKLALGHHGNDLVETMMMSMIYESKFRTFMPVTEQDRSGITVIRPFILAMEEDIKETAKRLDIKICKNPCPASDHTKRKYVKQILQGIERETPRAVTHMHRAILSFIH